MDDFIGRRNLIAPEKLRELTRRSDWKGAAQTLSHFGAIAVTGTGLWLAWGSWWAAPWFVLHGMLVNYLFCAQHECNHYTAFKTRWVNDVVNRITAFVLLYPRSYERWFHFEHHRHTQDWSRDPEIMNRKPSSSFSPIYPPKCSRRSVPRPPAPSPAPGARSAPSFQSVCGPANARSS